MNNEPVAWINREDGSSALDWDKDPYAQEHIPLYTHPVKELTDEEIEELKNAIKVCDYKYFGCYAFTDEQWDAFSVLNTYARAILRKAQEK